MRAMSKLPPNRNLSSNPDLSGADHRTQEDLAIEGGGGRVYEGCQPDPITGARKLP